MKANRENQRALSDEHYDEIGRSIAALVVDTGLGKTKAWALLNGLYMYKRWMLAHWVERYEEEAGRAPRAPRRAARAANVSKTAE